MKTIKLTLLLAVFGWMTPNPLKAQLVNIGSPLNAKQVNYYSQAVTAEKDTVWSVYNVYDSIDSKDYLRIAKYNGLFWTNYISVPASSYGNPMYAAFYQGDLYFNGNFRSIRIGANTYTDIAGLFKWDGSQISLVAKLGKQGANPHYAIRIDDIETFKNELYLSGSYDSIAGTPFNRVAKYNGTNWSVLGTAAERSSVQIYGRLVRNNNRLLIHGDTIPGSTIRYFGLISYDGTNLNPVDSAEITMTTNPQYINRLIAHPDSSSYYFNRTSPWEYFYAHKGESPTQILDSISPYWTAPNTPIETYAHNNGSVYTLQPGFNWGPRNQHSPIIQKFTGKNFKRIHPPSNLWMQYFTPQGTFGNNGVYFEFENELKNFKREFYRLDSNETLSSTLTGRAYVDLNGNCKYDIGDKPLVNKWIKLKNTGQKYSLYALTDAYGSYFIGGIAHGMDSVFTNKDVNKKFICGSQGTHAFNITKDTNLVRDFIYSYDSTKKDLEVRIFSSWGARVRRGFKDRYIVSVRNNSAFKRSGFVLVDVDSNFYDFSTTNPNITFVGKKIKFTFTDLAPDGYVKGDFTMRLPITVPLNTFVNINAALDSINHAWDNCPKNNTDTRKLRVRASCDPNDKTSNPEGEILPGTEDISYHINFQNVGNDTAYRVVIVDTIDNRLPLEKIVIGSSSHPFNLKIVNNTLVFEFDNIRLVDSATNEPLSKGFVRFHAKLDPKLPLGARVNNRAHIYFDFNEAIKTNVASVLIAQPSNVILIESKNLTVYPNPASNNVTIENTNNGKSYILVNTLGQLIQSGSLVNGTNHINTSALPNGIYILKIEGQEGMSKLHILH